jgi:hypothetical protein
MFDYVHTQVHIMVNRSYLKSARQHIHFYLNAKIQLHDVLNKKRPILWVILCYCVM